MKKYFVFAVVWFVLLISVMVWAGPARNDQTQWVIISYETLAITSGTTSLTYPTTREVYEVQIVFDGDDSRCFWNGRTPDSKTGAIISQGYMLKLNWNEMKLFKAAISDGGSGVTLIVTYYGDSM